jgi:nucleotide-binding universal stress UspA family protein
LNLVLSPLGIAVAVVFVMGLAGTLGWMLRVPPPAPRGATTTLRSVEAIRKVLVPILDLGASVRAVELAARLNQGHKAEMLIVYVHEIPLQAPLVKPEKDPRIQRALDAAAFIATQHAIAPRTRVDVARQAGHRIVEIAREEGVDLIVMGISGLNRPNEGPLGRVAEHVVRNAPCEVVVDRVPRQKVALIPMEVGETPPHPSPQGGGRISAPRG